MFSFQTKEYHHRGTEDTEGENMRPAFAPLAVSFAGGFLLVYSLNAARWG